MKLMASLWICFTVAFVSAPLSARERQPIALVYDGDGACVEGCWKAAAMMAERVGLAEVTSVFAPARSSHRKQFADTKTVRSRRLRPSSSFR